MIDQIVLDMGGSIVVPNVIDVPFLIEFKEFITKWLDHSPQRRAIIVVGGGGPAREYQSAFRQIVGDQFPDEEDRLGIAATHLNGALLKSLFGSDAPDPVVKNPEGEISFSGRILIGAGWKPGFSTDYDAVVLAERYKIPLLLNLSNIRQIYTEDPKVNPHAKPLEQLSWSEYRELAGGSGWTPGKNTPFDPVATAKAAEIGLKVVAASGKDLHNLHAILEGRPFVGTTIGPR